MHGLRFVAAFVFASVWLVWSLPGQTLLARHAGWPTMTETQAPAAVPPGAAESLRLSAASDWQPSYHAAVGPAASGVQRAARTADGFPVR